MRVDEKFLRQYQQRQGERKIVKAKLNATNRTGTSRKQIEVQTLIDQDRPGLDLLEHLTVHFPMRTESEINRPSGEHWSRRRKRIMAQHNEVSVEWRRASGGKSVRLPCVVKLTRHGAKELDDDNLRSALKATRDEVAKLLGVDDSPSSPVRFEYAQQAPEKWAVSIEVTAQ
jgi:hypothetical protein